MTAKYNVHWYKTSWGLVGEQNTYSNFSDFVNSAHSEGYHGIEFPINALGLTPDKYDCALSLLSVHISELGLKVIPLIATRTIEWSSAKAHLIDFDRQLTAAHILGASKVAVQAGADTFSMSDMISFFLTQWDISFQNASKNMMPISVVPEYGPPPYMPVHPENGKSLGDIATLNMWTNTKIEQVINTPEEVQ